MSGNMTPASKASKRPVVLMSKIPAARELCQLLGFPRSALKDTHIFIDTVNNWRETYVTSNGQPATQLLIWNQHSVQIELQSMAEKFLDHDRNGERFWSPDRVKSQSQVSGLQFPEDRER
jgi:hypothetical protein